MSGDRVRQLRQDLGLSQTELARRAGVSRQLIGALEAGRHLPRVDAALSLSAALGVDVAALFGTDHPPAEVVSGQPPSEGALVRLGQVGDQTVFSGARVGTAGWDVADGVVEGGEIQRLASIAPGVVMAGCEPGLEVLERILREAGKGAMSVGCSTSAAVGALEGARAHAAVVHAVPNAMQPRAPEEVTRFRLCSWRVGLAAPRGAQPSWVRSALSGRVPVVQREGGAGVQAAFERAAGKDVPGPVSTGHIESARLAVATGMPAVTIEPAAVALSARFHPLETHQAELWISREWIGDPDIEAVLNEISGRRFQRRLQGVGGYDLEGIGSRAV